MTPHGIIMGAKARAVLVGSLSMLFAPWLFPWGQPATPCCATEAQIPSSGSFGRSIARIVANESGPWSIGAAHSRDVLADTERDFSDGTRASPASAGRYMRQAPKRRHMASRHVRWPTPCSS